MLTDPLKPLWHRLDCDPPCFFADEFQQVFAPCPNRVLDLSILQQTTSSLTAPCRECGTGHIGTVHRFVNRRNGAATCVLECPTCGPTRIEAGELVRWVVDTPRLLNLVISIVGGRDEPSELVAGHVWRLGNVTWCGRSRETYFVRRLHEGSRGCITAALASHPKAALLFPTEETGRKWTTTSNPVFALESIFTLDELGLTFDPSAVECRLAAAGLLDAPKRKPTTQRRGNREANIARLETALVRFIREARKQAYTTRDMSGEFVIRPRPLQQDLARELGLDVSDVSRCLNDDKALTLQWLWRIANDPQQIMSFRGVPQKRPKV